MDLISYATLLKMNGSASFAEMNRYVDFCTEYGYNKCEVITLYGTKNSEMVGCLEGQS